MYTLTQEVEPSGATRPAREGRKRPPRTEDALARRRYRTVWISDLHLGTRGCQAELLLEFLESVDCDTLYLVGDIVDGWALERSWYWNDYHNRIIQRVLGLSSRGTRVVYVCGNHDEFLRRYLSHVFGGVTVQDEASHVTKDGRRLLVVHGDRYDVAVRCTPWLAHLGDRAYRACLTLNTWFNAVRKRFGYRYWSLSAFLKQKVKQAVSYIDGFERALVQEARRRRFDGVVCGHIHKAEIRDIDGILYCNDGDWVESCTALVEDATGELSIVEWGSEREVLLGSSA